MAGRLVVALLPAIAAASIIATSTRPRIARIRMAGSDARAAQELDAVPVFAILLAGSGKLYTHEGQCMVYTHLDDATRVLGRMQAAYAEEELELMPLSLGSVLTQAGWLKKATAASSSVELLLEQQDPQEPIRVNLVASPEELRAARRIREDGGVAKAKRRRGAAGKMQVVPIFHIGAVETAASEDDGGTAGATTPVWPFFFRRADVDALWQQVGEGQPLPTLRVTDLAALVDGLRDADALPDARPMICAPLDAVEYVRKRAQPPAGL